MAISKLHRWLEPAVASEVPAWPDRFSISPDQAYYVYRRIFGLLPEKCVRILDSHSVIYLVNVLISFLLDNDKGYEPGAEVI